MRPAAPGPPTLLSTARAIKVTDRPYPPYHRTDRRMTPWLWTRLARPRPPTLWCTARAMRRTRCSRATTRQSWRSDLALLPCWRSCRMSPRVLQMALVQSPASPPPVDGWRSILTPLRFSLLRAPSLYFSCSAPFCSVGLPASSTSSCLPVISAPGVLLAWGEGDRIQQRDLPTPPAGHLAA